MNTKTSTLLVILITIVLAVTSLHAQAPQLINYQGRLDKDDLPANGSFLIEFSIHDDSTDGSLLWSEEHTDVAVAGGLFNVLLGSVNPLRATVFGGAKSRYLEIRVSNETIEPRFLLASVAYALQAENSVNADTAQFAMAPDGHSLDSEDGKLEDVVFVKNNGNVGIGGGGIEGRTQKVEYPREQLEIRGSILLSYPTNGTKPDKGIFFTNKNRGVKRLAKSPDVELFTTNGSLIFNTQILQDGLAVRKPRMIIDKNGNIIFSDPDAESNKKNKFLSSSGGLLLFGKFDDSRAVRATQAVIDNNGNVGIGLINPDEKLHVDGNIKATGTINGVMVDLSSREYKENIQDLSLSDAVSTLKELEPVRFNFKAEKDKDLHIGFIAEEVPALVATADRRGVSPMDIIAVLTKVVQEQQKNISKLEDRIRALEK
jgi:hypothetical protein